MYKIIINDEIKQCPKFGKRKLYTPNRKLYGGNPTTEANKEFINKTVEKIFIDQRNQDEINLNEDEDTNRQKDNENIFNKKMVFV